MACNAKCGHLAAYVSQAEQGEVESWYTNEVRPFWLPFCTAACCHGLRMACVPGDWSGIAMLRQEATVADSKAPGLAQGYLFPAYHQNYWIGLISNSSAYPRFTWIDITIKPPGVQGSYKHWGVRRSSMPAKCLAPAHWSRLATSACPAQRCLNRPSVLARRPVHACQAVRAVRTRRAGVLRRVQLHRDLRLASDLGLGRHRVRQLLHLNVPAAEWVAGLPSHLPAEHACMLCCSSTRRSLHELCNDELDRRFSFSKTILVAGWP